VNTGTRFSDGNRVPSYLMDMPKRVLFGSCRAIEKWCAENDKVRPTLLDLDRARRARKGERR
jgi:hypothetical protein